MKCCLLLVKNRFHVKTALLRVWTPGRQQWERLQHHSYMQIPVVGKQHGWKWLSEQVPASSVSQIRQWLTGLARQGPSRYSQLDSARPQGRHISCNCHIQSRTYLWPCPSSLLSARPGMSCICAHTRPCCRRRNSCRTVWGTPLPAPNRWSSSLHISDLVFDWTRSYLSDLSLLLPWIANLVCANWSWGES